MQVNFFLVRFYWCTDSFDAVEYWWTDHTGRLLLVFHKWWPEFTGSLTMVYNGYWWVVTGVLGYCWVVTGGRYSYVFR